MRGLVAILVGFGCAFVMIFALALTGLFSPVHGQTVAESPPACGPLEQMIVYLAEHYHERILFEGIVNDGSRMMITANPDGSTWTAITVDLATTACLRIVGNSWRGGAQVFPVPSPGTEG